MAYYREGKLSQSKEEILEAIKKYPGYVEAHIHYQTIRAQEISPGELLKEYDRLLKQNEGDPRFQFLYGRLLGELEKQEAVYNRAIELDEKSPWGYFGLGWVNFKRSAYESAAEYVKKAIELAPDVALFHCDLGSIYYFMGMYEDAVRELNIARELNPLFPSAFANLSVAYYQRGDFDMSVRMLEEYTRLVPISSDFADMHRKLVQLRGK
jgi:tetratricopeptide (TPR) repeat protein